MDVDDEGVPYVINVNGYILYKPNNTIYWRQLVGIAKDIAVGAYEDK